MKENCCKNCKHSEGYSGLDEHHCAALHHDIRSERYDCEYFVEDGIKESDI